MNARDFHDQIVKPTLKEFDLEYSSQRKAFLAAIVMDALVAHIFAEAKQHHLDPFKLLGGRYVRTSGPNKGDISILDFDETNDKDIAFTQGVTSAQCNDTYFRELITNYCDYFKIIRDLAKANKHAELTRGRPLVKSSDQLISKSVKSSLGRYGEARTDDSVQVIIQTEWSKKGGNIENADYYFEHVLHEAYETVASLLCLLDAKIGRDHREYSWHMSNEG